MQSNQPVAIITGASRGIGKAVAQHLACHGIRVALLARDAQDLAIAQQEIEARQGIAMTFPVSILDEAALQSVFEKIWNLWGRIDVLVNNAGIGVFKTIAETTQEDWDNVMDTNTKGTFLATKFVIPYFKEQKRGHIITITSDVARRTFAYGGLYCASKYAQDALMSAVRQEVHAYGVKVSTLYPGLTETYFHGQQPAATPNLNRLQPEDIAQAVHYIYDAPAHVVIDELHIHPMAQKYWENR